MAFVVLENAKVSIDFRVFSIYNQQVSGSMVKRLRHRPFTAVTGVRIPLESFGK